MGIFSKLKSMFSNDIVFDPQKAKSVVMPQPLKGGKIKVESKVKVPENYCFVLGSAGRCLDAFYVGEYFLTAATLPECCKRLKIHKMDKKNRIKKNFKADAYFVKNSIELKMKTNSKAELGNRTNGIFRVGLECNVKMKVLDVKKYMQVLLDEYAYLRAGEAEKITLAYLSDFMLDILYRFNFSLFELVQCNPKVEERIKEELARRVSKIGLALEDMTEVRYILPKKSQKEYEENLKKKNQPEEEQKEQPEVKEEPKEIPEEVQDEQPEVQPQEEAKEEKLKQTPKFDDDYTPFGGIVIEEQLTQEQKQEVAEEQKPEEEPPQPAPKVEKTPMEQIEEQFVDLNLDNLYKNDRKGKRCKKCGYLNDEDATICDVCQTELD